MFSIGVFEDNVQRYDTWFERNRFAYESEVEALRALISGKGAGIEVGVGTGRFAARLGIRTGLEPSMGMGKLAVQRGIDVCLGVGENLPFPDACFDRVLFVTVICFLDDVLLSFQEAHRVLKPGGQITIGFIDRKSALGNAYDKHKQDNAFYRHATFYSVDQVVSMLEQAGFHHFGFVQTIFQNPSEMKAPDPVKPGHGEGAFVVVNGYLV